MYFFKNEHPAAARLAFNIITGMSRGGPEDGSRLLIMENKKEVLMKSKQKISYYVYMSESLYCFSKWPAASHIFVTISFHCARQKRGTRQRHFLKSISVVTQAVTADTLTQ